MDSFFLLKCENYDSKICFANVLSARAVQTFNWEYWYNNSYMSFVNKLKYQKYVLNFYLLYGISLKSWGIILNYEK